MVQNPKTTAAGYLGLFGMLCAGLAQLVPGKWGQWASMAGIAITGAASAMGNISSQDGGR